MKLSSPHWAGRYVGIPFADNGSSREGCNCWGLVRLVLLQERAIDLPTYGEISAADLLKAARAFDADCKLAPWHPVARDKVQAFDVALMHAMTQDEGRRVPAHVGILISRSRVLHVWRATDAVHRPLDHPRIRVIGFYRHQALIPQS